MVGSYYYTPARQSVLGLSIRNIVVSHSAISQLDDGTVGWSVTLKGIACWIAVSSTRVIKLGGSNTLVNEL